jgi:SAM-dependent methyltransferase
MATPDSVLLYGERAAPVYDDDAPPCDERMLDALATLAGRGRTLELGIGTGRVALPLAQRGVNIEGIDLSPAMVERLHAKPGGADIKVTMGSFADLDVEGRFELIYVVYNTFYMLSSRNEQVRCLERVARHLHPGGSFVFEGFLLAAAEPEDPEWPRERITLDYLGRGSAGVRNYPLELRVPSPTELDRMARRAGLQPSAHWSSWDAEPFDDLARSHIAIYTA